MRLGIPMAVLAVILLGVMTMSATKTDTNTPEATKTSFTLASPAFSDGQSIPAKYTGDSKDVSPPLTWANPPGGTKAFCLVCDDPDAPGKTWVHWVIYNIPPHALSLPEALEPNEIVFDGIRQGVNDFGNTGYGGPAPPKGKPHRYFFKLYALNTAIDLKSGASKADLMRIIEGKVIEETVLMGKYQRK